MLLKAQLGNRVGFAASILDGLTVTESEPNSSTANVETKAFVKEVLKSFEAAKKTKAA
jgi:hypothetical protein